MDWSELGNWHEYPKLYVGLAAMMSPAVFIPVFLGLVADKPTHTQKRVTNIAAGGTLVVLVVFNFVGESLLELFGITLPAFRAAGGLLLVITSLEMMRGSIGTVVSSEGTDIVALALVPLTIPILAGPGAISTVIVFSTLEPGAAHRLVLAATILAVVATVFVLMRIAIAVGHLFNDSVNVAFMSVMGLIVAAIGVEFIFDGVAGHFPDLRTID